MKKRLNVIELCSGIMANTYALKKQGFDYVLIDSVEYDKKAINIANIMYETKFETKSVIDYHYEGKEEIDLITMGPPCFTGDMQIWTSQGYKKIIDIKNGDKVLTYKLEYKPVLNWFNQGQKEIWELVFTKNNKIKTTENHKFYIYDIKSKKFEWLELNKINKDQHYFTKPISQVEKTFYNDNPDFWYIVGRWLGDGWLRNRKEKNNKLSSLIICAGKSKRKYLEEKLNKVFKTYTNSEERTVFKYTIYSQELAKWLNDNFGRGAKNKKINQNILDLPKNLLKELFQGYLDSDGSKKPNGAFRTSSISKELTFGMELIALKLGYKTTIYKDLRPETCIIEGREVNQNNSYELRELKEKNIIIDNYYCVKAQEIINTNTFENVYDIEVKKHNSFIVENIIVHNCQDLSNAGLGKGMEQGSETRSSVVWDCFRVINEVQPKYFLWENVKGMLNKKHSQAFNDLLKLIDEIGYKFHKKVLNARDFGIPQNRERVFIIGIRKDIKNDFNFDNLETTPMKPLSDFLETPEDPWYYVKSKQEWFKDRMKGLERERERESKPKNISVLDPGTATDYVDTIITEQWKGNNQGAILEQTKENSFIKMSDGTTRPTFKESKNGILTLPISKNFTSCKVASGGGQIQTILSGIPVKILEKLEKEQEDNGVGQHYKEYKNFLVVPRATDNKIVNGAYNRVWKEEVVGCLNTSNQPKNIEHNDKKFFFKRDCIIKEYCNIITNEARHGHRGANNKILEVQGSKIKGYSNFNSECVITTPEHTPNNCLRSIITSEVFNGNK